MKKIFGKNGLNRTKNIQKPLNNIPKMNLKDKEANNEVIWQRGGRYEIRYSKKLVNLTCIIYK